MSADRFHQLEANTGLIQQEKATRKYGERSRVFRKMFLHARHKSSTVNDGERRRLLSSIAEPSSQYIYIAAGLCRCEEIDYDCVVLHGDQ
jgi:hypothetical protein